MSTAQFYNFTSWKKQLMKNVPRSLMKLSSPSYYASIFIIANFLQNFIPYVIVILPLIRHCNLIFYMVKTNFNACYQEHKDTLNENLNKFKEFEEKFWKDGIKKLSLETYCIWTGEGSFSYYLEFWLTWLWSIKWWSSYKFWVFKSSKGGYSYVASRFQDENDALDKIKKAIISIINLNLSNLDKTKLEEISDVFSPMVARKITYLYHIDKLLPIYTDSLLEEFLYESNKNELIWSYEAWIKENMGLLANTKKEYGDPDLDEKEGIKTDLISRFLFDQKGYDDNTVNQEIKSENDNENIILINEMVIKYESIVSDSEKIKNEIKEINKTLWDTKEDISKQLNDTQEKLLDTKNEMVWKSIEYIWILWVILTVIFINTSIFSKLDISEPQDLIGIILLINTLPIIFYFVVLFLWDKKLSDKDNISKIKFFLSFLIIQFTLACLFLLL